MKISKIKISKIVPYASNSRTHGSEQISQIAESIKEFGFNNPVLIDGSNVIIAGHGRVLAAEELGLDTIPVVVLDHLSESQRKAYVIADNKLALNAGWDMDLLALEMGGLKDDGFDLSLIGFDDHELADIFADKNPGLTDPDTVPDTPETPIAKEGDIWVLGKHRLMCGDSTSIDAVEKLMDGVKADMVFTDPPYGVDYDGGHNKKKRKGIIADDLEGDNLTGLFYGAISTAIISAKDGAAFYIWFASGKSIETFASLNELPLELRAVIQWYKVKSGLGAFMSQYIPNCEPCMYLHKKGHSPAWYGPTTEKTVWELKKESRNEFHPTQKPVELVTRALRNSSKAGDVILDLFGGSGSTMLSAEISGRESRLMELDPKYCDVIVKRWQDFTGEQAILESTKKPFAEAT